VTPPAKPITIAIMAMGGEGGGVLADWIVDLAEHQGYLAQTTSVPGVAQRTGSTIYYLELFPAGGPEPILALMPIPGEVDVVIGSELMEAGRAVQRGLVTPDRTAFIASTHRVYSMSERTAMGDARADSAKLLAACAESARQFVHADFAQVAEEAGSVISAALFGGLARSAALPFERAQFEAAIHRGGLGVEASLRAFALGFERAAKPTESPATPSGQEPGPKLAGLVARIEAGFAEEARSVLKAGIVRLADYQDERYAARYLHLLQPLHANGALLQEAARQLALWMSYEDAIRVADLKIRATRFERVRQEVRVASGQLLQIDEFLHPGVEEIADILPAALGRFLLRTNPAQRMVKAFTGEGKIVRTTSLAGFLQLYFLAMLRPLRRRSLRFQEEHCKIERWLAMLQELAHEDSALALEFAKCPTLIKGYGATRAAGTRNYDAIVAIIPKLRGRPGAPGIVRKLREAALADENGTLLAEALKETTA
jgi:indolepyruvate ferredoxin oxidoreductase, beta subunit